ncbi:MAG TPA: hypothetical protein VEC16_00600 [Alphaproteobacteria bacterium]|nr:hypothetical protein [Alphaproteobacteria bacterium]
MSSINQKVLEYIKYYSSQGYTIDKIREFLLKNGISAKDIDDTISYINSFKSQPTNASKNTILESQIRNYITTQMRNGYNIDLIKSALLRNGFDLATVNNVANEFNPGNYNNSGNGSINIKHEVHFSHGTILGIVAILLVAVGIFGFLNFGPIGSSQSDSLLDVSVTTTAYSYISGNTINYQIFITNMGSQKRFDAIIKTLIVDDSGNIITRKEETIAVETTSSVNRNIALPQNTPSGTYYLRIIADYDGKQATSSSEFQVVKNAGDIKPAPSTGTGSNTNPSTGSNAGSGSNSGNTNTGSQGSNTGSENTDNSINTPTFGALLTEIRGIAKNNPNMASNRCKDLSSVQQKDVCFEAIADSSGLTSYCANVEESTRRDNCYLAFVLKGNVEVCAYIIDSNSKAFCDQLKIVQLMDKYYKENNTEKIIELSEQFNPSIYNSNPQIPSYEYTYVETATISIVDIVNEEQPAQEVPEETDPPAQ